MKFAVGDGHAFPCRIGRIFKAANGCVEAIDSILLDLELYNVSNEPYDLSNGKAIKSFQSDIRLLTKALQSHKESELNSSVSQETASRNS